MEQTRKEVKDLKFLVLCTELVFFKGRFYWLQKRKHVKREKNIKKNTKNPNSMLFCLMLFDFDNEVFGKLEGPRSGASIRILSF